MISNKELQYVSSYARQTPYPGDDYAYNVLYNLQEAVKLFQRQYLEKSHNLIFSNGEEIEFRVLEKNLAHLLGIDTKNINSEFMLDVKEKVLGFSLNEYTGSYEILTRIIDCSEDIIKNDKNPYNKRILNYYKIMIKCAIFSKLSTSALLPNVFLISLPISSIYFFTFRAFSNVKVISWSPYTPFLHRLAIFIAKVPFLP